MSTKELYVDVCKSKDALEDEVDFLKNDIANKQVTPLFSLNSKRVSSLQSKYAIYVQHVVCIVFVLLKPSFLHSH